MKTSNFETAWSFLHRDLADAAVAFRKAQERAMSDFFQRAEGKPIIRASKESEEQKP